MNDIRVGCGWLGLLAAVTALGACGGGGSAQDAPGQAGSASSSARPAASGSSTTAPTAKPAAAPVTLADRFGGPAPAGIARSAQRLGVPAGWEKGEFGEVKTANKDGYAALYDLPQFPPAQAQVELRAVSMGCKPAKLEPAVDGVIGTKKVPAKIYQGTCTFDGAAAAVWAVAVNIDKTDNPKVIVVAIKESARPAIEKDVPAIIQGYADAW